MKRGLIFLFVLLFSCDKDDITGNPERKKATVIDAGVDIPEGCDWQIVLDNGTIYHPENLPPHAKQDDLDVWVDFLNTTDSFYCGIEPSSYPVIHIISIVPR